MLSATLLGVVFVPIFFVAVMSMFGSKKNQESPPDAASGGKGESV